ncbi:MAG: hypothetical protein GY869_14740, partial [Planctomycetes bacterium]|nr:hypothetical protein [Planctomycetota bacterium]
NDAPVAADDDAATDEDIPLTISEALNNDSDIDQDNLTINTFTQPNHGTVVLNNNQAFTYTPDANYFGTDSFTYTISDTNGATDTAIINITVNPVNDAPIIGDQSFDLDENSDSETVVGQLNVTDFDPDDTLAFVIVAGNIDDSFAIDSSGQITVQNPIYLDYESNPNFELTVQVSDSTGLIQNATITVNLNDIYEAPPVEDIPVIDDPLQDDSFTPEDDTTPTVDPPTIDHTPAPKESPGNDSSSDENNINDPEPENETVNTTENGETQTESSNQSSDSSSEQSNAPGNQTESQQNSESNSSQNNKPDAVHANQVSLNYQGSAASQNSYAASQAALSAANDFNNVNNFDQPESMDNKGIVEFHPEAAALELEMFQEQLDNITEQLDQQSDEQTHTEEISVGVVTGFTGAVSFGYGLWILRGGSLLASMASSLPVLSSIDPLPVLEKWQSSSTRKQRLKSDLLPEDAAEMKIDSLLK